MISSHDSLQLRQRCWPQLLLVTAVLAVYFPAISSGIHTVDDPGIVALYGSSAPLLQILLPGNEYYYRPLLQLTFWLDNLLWGMLPATLHLENVLLHCLNTLLLFSLACKVRQAAAEPGDPVQQQKEAFPVAPFVAALLFALHPVNVEPVAWIAGRSDLLLTAMLLLALSFWLRWLERPRWGALAAALFFFAAALLSKETAVAAGPVALVLALVWPGAASLKKRLGAIAVMAAPPLLLLLMALSSQNSGLSRFFSAADAGIGKGVWQGVVALGFYARKIAFPLPLNFAISEVHPLHGLLGLALLPGLLWLLKRRRLAGALLWCALILLLPALLVSVKQVAWTPYAERYLYLPATFALLPLAACPGSSRVRRDKLLALCALLLVGGGAFLSLQRNFLWQDKLAFVRDTIANSPGFGSPYSELGKLLLANGELDQAEQAFITADRLNRRESMRLPIKLDLLGVKFVKGDYAAVRSRFFEIFRHKREAPPEFLELLHRSDSRRLAALTGRKREELARDLIETLDLLGEKRYDPFWLYRTAQLSLELGEREKAKDFFSRARAAAPADAHYKKAAGIYLEKLEKTQ